MKYRQLGRSGIQISEIGFGAWGIGGLVQDSSAYGPTNDKVSRQALMTAFNYGVTFFDTSALYGYGHSEELIGEAFSGGLRDRVVISTKAGYVNFSGLQDFSPGYLRGSLEASLRRLKTDYVDLFQLHDPPMELFENDDSIMNTMEKLKDEGKIRVIGISARSPMDSLMAVERLGVGSVQVNFNLVDQRALDAGLFSACHRNGVGIIARTPLCFGFLTGKYSAEDEYAEGDHRRRWKQEQVKLWSEACRLFNKGLEDGVTQTDAQMALRYVLSFPEISSAIPGMLTNEHVMENIAASDLGAFSQVTLQEFTRIYGRHNFFV